MGGGALADLIKQVIETPADLRERVKQAIQPKNTVNLPGAKIGERMKFRAAVTFFPRGRRGCPRGIG